LQETSLTGDKPYLANLLPAQVRNMLPQNIRQVLKCNSATYRHKLIKQHHVLLLSQAHVSHPTFGRVITLFYEADTDTLIISYEVLNVISYNNAALAYTVELTGRHAAINAASLQHPLPCFTHKERGQLNRAYVTLQSHRLHTMNNRLG